MAPLDGRRRGPCRSAWPRRGPTTGSTAEAAEDVVRAMLDAVADAMPRAAPTGRGQRPAGRPAATFEQRLRERLSALRRADGRAAPAGPDLAAGRGRRGGAGRRARSGWCSRSTTSRTRCTSATPRCCGPATSGEHGFGDRARTHAAIALRGAAEAWPVLDRLLELRVPDQITLDGDELVSLLDDGVAALARARRRRALAAQPGPRPDRHDGARPVPRRGRGARPSSATGVFGEDELFSFRWQLAVHGDPLTEEEMEQLATRRRSAAAAARQLDRRRPGDRPQGAQAAWSARRRRPRRSRRH